MENKSKMTSGFAIWFTGLSSSGKTTLVNLLDTYLTELGYPVIKLDGDEIRPIIAEGYGFSEADRIKVTRKYVMLSNLLVKSPVIVLVAAINHTEVQRKFAKQNHPSGKYVEVWVNTPLDECIRRDVKGLYQKAKDGKMDNMIGIHFPFETPENPDIIIETVMENPNQGTQKIVEFLISRKII